MKVNKYLLSLDNGWDEVLAPVDIKLTITAPNSSVLAKRNWGGEGRVTGGRRWVPWSRRISLRRCYRSWEESQGALKEREFQAEGRAGAKTLTWVRPVRQTARFARLDRELWTKGRTKEDSGGGRERSLMIRTNLLQLQEETTKRKGDLP